MNVSPPAESRTLMSDEDTEGRNGYMSGTNIHSLQPLGLRMISNSPMSKLPSLSNNVSPRGSGEWNLVKYSNSMTTKKKYLSNIVRQTKSDLAKVKTNVPGDSRHYQLTNWGQPGHKRNTSG